MGPGFDLGSMLGAGATLLVMPQVALAIYIILVWDARRAGSPAAGDEQLGIKTVAATLAIIGVLTGAMGLQQLLTVMLTFTDFLARFKAAIPDVITGALALVVALFVIFPKTNAAQFPKARRLTAGAIAVGGAVAVVASLASFLRAVISWPSWDAVADALTAFVVSVAVFGAGLMALMKLSGLVAARPARPQQPQAPYPPQQGQYAPQPGQYPPQPGQYPPQPGQYPPQPGPPQQGQYPPQQGQPQQPPPGGWQQR